MRNACCVLRVAYSLHCSLFTHRYSLLATRYSLLATRYSSSPALLPEGGKADDGPHHVVVSRDPQDIDPGSLEDFIQLVLALPRCLLEPLAEFPIMRVHVEMFARLRIFHNDRANIRQLGFARVRNADGD